MQIPLHFNNNRKNVGILLVIVSLPVFCCISSAIADYVEIGRDKFRISGTRRQVCEQLEGHPSFWIGHSCGKYFSRPKSWKIPEHPQKTAKRGKHVHYPTTAIH